MIHFESSQKVMFRISLSCVFFFHFSFLVLCIFTCFRNDLAKNAMTYHGMEKKLQKNRIINSQTPNK